MFTKQIYQTYLADKIREIDKRLLEIVQSADLSKRYHPILMDAVSQGRRFRPLLMIITNKGVGGEWGKIIDPACALELLHKASLIHDDIIDEDILRRGKPTFWKVYGKKQAIVMGDFLIGLSMKSVFNWCKQYDSSKAQEIFDIYTSALNETILGEFYDVQFETDSNVNYDDIEQMMSIKSGSLIAAAMHIGAVSGGASEELTNTLTRIGRCIGIIFQMINDMNSITGRDGPSKGIHNNDVLQKKKTPATYVLKEAGISYEQLKSLDKDDLLNILAPVLSTIEMKVGEAEVYINKLPNGITKKLLLKLLKEAQNDWFWIDQDD